MREKEAFEREVARMTAAGIYMCLCVYGCVCMGGGCGDVWVCG